jgi:hypothetical protein
MTKVPSLPPHPSQSVGHLKLLIKAAVAVPARPRLHLISAAAYPLSHPDIGQLGYFNRRFDLFSRVGFGDGTRHDHESLVVEPRVRGRTETSWTARSTVRRPRRGHETLYTVSLRLGPCQRDGRAHPARVRQSPACLMAPWRG